VIRLGDPVKVKNSEIEGLLIYETKNTFWIKNDHVVIVPKNGNVFEVRGKLYHGIRLAKRPWERLDPR